MCAFKGSPGPIKVSGSVSAMSDQVSWMRRDIHPSSDNVLAIPLSTRNFDAPANDAQNDNRHVTVYCLRIIPPERIGNDNCYHTQVDKFSGTISCFVENVSRVQLSKSNVASLRHAGGTTLVR